jgi:hypothetical protein
MKTKIIYEKKGTRVYIHECHRNIPRYKTLRKTRLFAVRRDDKTGLCHLLGEIRFDWAWRQYIFFPDAFTKWSPGCLEGISNFTRELTKKWRQKQKR